MTTANKELAAQLYDALNRRDFDKLGELLSEDCRTHLPGQPSGPAGYRRVLASYVEAFNDLQHEAIDMIAEGDRVAVVTRTSGTHCGTFLGHAPTGRRFSAVGIDTLRFRDGRIIERDGVFDTISMLRQLGLYG
jgi:steroid delta-isomerase-like uncharacterized protein